MTLSKVNVHPLTNPRLDAEGGGRVPLESWHPGGDKKIKKRSGCYFKKSGLMSNGTVKGSGSSEGRNMVGERLSTAIMG